MDEAAFASQGLSLVILTTDGALSTEGTFHPLETWDGQAIMTLFRQALVERLVDLVADLEQALATV